MCRVLRFGNLASLSVGASAVGVVGQENLTSNANGPIGNLGYYLAADRFGLYVNVGIAVVFYFSLFLSLFLFSSLLFLFSSLLFSSLLFSSLFFSFLFLATIFFADILFSTEPVANGGRQPGLQLQYSLCWQPPHSERHQHSTQRRHFHGEWRAELRDALSRSSDDFERTADWLVGVKQL